MLSGLEGRGLQVRYWKFLKYKFTGQFTVVLLNSRQFCPPEDIGQCLETFLSPREEGVSAIGI